MDLSNEEMFKQVVLCTDQTSKYYVPDLEYPVAQFNFLESNTKLIDNKPMPCYIRNLDVIKSMHVRSDDTFVVGCPKSGRF